MGDTACNVNGVLGLSLLYFYTRIKPKTWLRSMDIQILLNDLMVNKFVTCLSPLWSWVQIQLMEPYGINFGSVTIK